MAMASDITRATIDAVHKTIAPYVRETPVVTAEARDFGLAGAPIAFKLELLQHAGSFKPKQGIKQIIGIAPEKRSCQAHNPVDTGRQSAKCIPLCRIAGQLMDLIANRIVKPSRHIAADELDRRQTADLVSISLPERTVKRSTSLVASGLDALGNLDLLKLGDR